MTKVVRIASVCVVSILVLLVACAPKSAATPVPQTQAPAPSSTVTSGKAAPATAPGKQAWEVEWEKTLSAARQEGKVVLTSTAGGELRTVLTQGTKDAYGISAEMLSGRTAESLAKIFAERRAGMYLEDVNISGLNSMLTQAKPGGILESMDSALILPEVTGTSNWYQNQIPWVDKEHTLLRLSLHPNVPMAVNTDLVKTGEIKSWRDLLDPKWSGKLVFNDPTISGAGQQGLQGLQSLMGDEYVKELVNKMKPTVMRDQRLQLEWLSHGKVSVVIVPTPEVLIEFVKASAPIAVIVPQEGNWLSSGTAGVSLYTKAAHPNAAKVFINWLASKQGQEAYAPVAWHQSLRVDVSTSHLPPWRIRTEGVKYVDLNTEDATLRAAGVAQVAKDLFGPLMK